MSKRLVLVGVLVASVAIWFWLGRSVVEVESIDLIGAFDLAEKRTDRGSLEGAFGVESTTIGDVTKQSIFAHPTSRIIWRIQVPENAWLRTSLALKPEA